MSMSQMRSTVMLKIDFTHWEFIHHIHETLRHRIDMAGMKRALATLFGLLLLASLLPTPSAAQTPIGSISLECGDDPELQVKPGEYEESIEQKLNTVHFCCATIGVLHHTGSFSHRQKKL